MTDKNFFRMMGTLQFMIAFINYYVALGAANAGSTLGLATSAICVMAGVICTVAGAKLWGFLQ